MTEADIVAAYDKLRKHALSNYERDGWDYFVETVDLKEFIKEILRNGLYDYAAICKHYADWFRNLNDCRADIEGERF